MTESKKSAASTESAEDAARRFAGECEQLRRENEALTRQLDELRAAGGTSPAAASATAATGYRNPGPPNPSFALSEGERADLEQHGATRSAFTGGLLLADEQGVEPGSDTARENMERARRRRDEHPDDIRDEQRGERREGREQGREQGREGRDPGRRGARPPDTPGAVPPGPARP